jgi:hypothetical protein
MELKISDFKTVNELDAYIKKNLKGAKLDYDRHTEELVIRTGLTFTDEGATTTAR